MQFIPNTLSGLALLCLTLTTQAEILPEAEIGIKIPLAKKPTTRPMGVAYFAQQPALLYC
jgi:hypothetical protein